MSFSSILPGAPSLLNGALASAPLPVLMLADQLGLGSLLGGPQWGIFTAGGTPVVMADSTVKLEFAQDIKISDFPVEDGGFRSYNRVVAPFATKITFAIGGSFNLLAAAEGLISAISAGSFGGALAALSGETARTAFLAALDAAAKSVELFTVVTPTATYASASITHYDYRRTAREGATLLEVDVWLEEVRIAATTTFSATQSTNGTAQTNGGTVQAAQAGTAPVGDTSASPATVPVQSAPLAALPTPTTASAAGPRAVALPSIWQPAT